MSVTDETWTAHLTISPTPADPRSRLCKIKSVVLASVLLESVALV